MLQENTTVDPNTPLILQFYFNFFWKTEQRKRVFYLIFTCHKQFLKDSSVQSHIFHRQKLQSTIWIHTSSKRFVRIAQATSLPNFEKNFQIISQEYF